MNFRRKRKGSSFIFVIIMFMFVITVSTAMLSMVSGNYASRVSESKRIENLYGAECGLDIAYNIATKTIEDTNKYATDCTKKFQKEVEKLEKESKWIDTDSNIIIDIDGISTIFSSNDTKNLYSLYSHIDYLKALEEDKSSEIDLYSEYIDEFLNYIFKDKFKDYIDKNLKTNIVGETINNIQNGKINGEYVSYDKDVEIVIDNDTLIWNDLDSENIISEKNLVVKYGYDDDGKIDREIEHDIEFICKNQTSDVIVKSNFKTDRDSTNETRVGKNTKEIQVTFSITVPNYDEVSFKNSITYPNIKDIPGLTIGGEMIIDNSNVNVTGDIFVQGIDSDDNINLSNKYSNGISIDSDSQKTINFNNNIYSRETFNIKNSVNVNVKGDLYAKNIYASSDKNTKDDKSILNVNSNENQKVILDNDLEVKAQYTDINIKNFYGINEYIESDALKSEKIRKSSSIIVNNQNSTSNITIENEAYILGVAHVNTNDDGYQTGESVAVKGNYEAYSVLQSENDQFEYHNPLQLLDGDLQKKSTYFSNYWKNNNEKSVDCGGVVFLNPTKVKSVGALVYKDGNQSKVAESNFLLEDFNNSSSVKVLRKDYAWKIYNMGIEQENEISDDDYINPIYIKNSISDIVDFNSDIEGNDSFIFNNNKNKTIIITSSQDNTFDLITGDKEIIRKTNLNAVIV